MRKLVTISLVFDPILLWVDATGQTCWSNVCAKQRRVIHWSDERNSASGVL